MTAQIRTAAMIVLALTIASCTVSMMYIFISGKPGGGDMQTLLLAQTLAIAPAILVVIANQLFQLRDGKHGLGNIWRAIPAWLVLALLLPNLLVVIGELSLFLRARLTNGPVHWFEHAPLVCTFACSLALAALYARSYPPGDENAAGVGRW